MGFKTDGTSHSSGVKNESNICTFLNESPQDPLGIKKCLNCSDSSLLHYTHIGGTKDVSDMNISLDGKLISGCSIKNHKKGTFDYINTSLLSNYLSPDKVKKIDIMKSELVRKYHKKPELIETCRKENDEFINGILSCLNSDGIKNILRAINQRNPELFIINDTKKNKYLMFKKEQFRELYTYPYEETTYIVKTKKNSKTSRCIYRVDECGNETDTHLRIRLTLNNGVNALLGLSTSNSSSSYSIKVQQDDVDSHITEPYSSCDY